MESVSIQKRLIEPKEKLLEILIKQYEASCGQLLKQLSEADKITIEESIRQKEKEIKDLNQEIENYKVVDKQDARSYDIYHSHWEESLPKIDFKSSKVIIDEVLEKLGRNQEKSALFLLQNSAPMEGELCVGYINSRLRLQDIGTWKAPCIADFLPHQVPTRLDFLNKFANQFEVPSIDISTQDYTHAILDKICGSLWGSDVLLIQVGLYRLDAQDTFLEWFVNDFWQALVQQKLSERSRDHPFIKVVGVITIRSRVAKSYLPSALCCKKQTFDGGKILELPLKKWTETDISDWLFRFSKLTEPQVGLTRVDIERMANSIYHVTAGAPTSVRNELMKQMTQYIS